MKTGADAAAANVSMICTHVAIWLGIEPQEAPLCISGIDNILIEMEPRTCTRPARCSVEFPAQTHMQFGCSRKAS